MSLDSLKVWNIGGAQVTVERDHDGLKQATVAPCRTAAQSKRVLAFVAQQIDDNFKGHKATVKGNVITVTTDTDQVISGDRKPSYVDAVFKDIEKQYSNSDSLPKPSVQDEYAGIAAAATSAVAKATRSEGKSAAR